MRTGAHGRGGQRHGIAQLWAWGSLQLALSAAPLADKHGEAELDRLITTALNAYLGRATA